MLLKPGRAYLTHHQAVSGGNGRDNSGWTVQNSVQEFISRPLMKPRLGNAGGLREGWGGGGPARRRLFGPVDHQQLYLDAQRLLRLGLEAAARRWNFDFLTEAPGAAGNPEWEELSARDVPAFYRSRAAPGGAPGGGGGARKDARRTSTSSGEESPTSGSSSGDEYLEVTTRGRYRLQRPGKRRQAAITDFFKVKKRKLLQDKPTFLQ
ncbi:LOW QUALITY PROTEIN: cyclin-dependent kinase inhibitor 1D [Menidia menidia]